MGEKKAEQKEVEQVKNEVISLLARHNIPIDNWGQGPSKTIDHLVKEVMEGETVLSDNESGDLVRKISIAYIDVYYHDPANGKKLILFEEKQVFKDGRERRRKPSASVSEKIKPQENPDQDAVSRALQEELGISGSVLTTAGDKKESLKETESYPGLKVSAAEYYFGAELNKDQYNPVGYIEHQADKETYFKWKEVR